MAISGDTLLTAYRTFWRSFLTHARVSGGLGKPIDGHTFEIDKEWPVRKQVAITALCHFPDWPFRASSSKERIDISIRSLEVYSRAKEKLEKSNVQVLYSQTQDSVARTLLALHYDFETPARPAHPIFHAQVGEGLKATDLRLFDFASTLTPAPSGTLYSNVRIPTPCMNFGSVVLGLAADHLGPSAYASILTLARNTNLLRWQANCGALQRSVASNVYLPSYHWYE